MLADAKQRLEKQELVRLAQRSSDARVTEVVITASGERAAMKVREVASRIFASTFANSSAAEITEFNSILRRLHHNLADSAQAGTPCQ